MDADWIEDAVTRPMDESDSLPFEQGGRKPKDRDFLQTRDGMFFCVTGYLHPPDRYTAYLKYSPVKEGKWKNGETSYHRELEYYHVDQVAKTIAYLESAYPQYVHYCPVRDIRFSMVPHAYVREYYSPEQRLKEILRAPQDSLEQEVSAFAAEIVAIAGIDAGDLGITGSILLEMHNPSFSDIDLLVYGLENAQKIRTALKEGRSSRVQPVVGETLQEWCASVAEHFSLDYKDACHLAKRRWNYGFFEGRYFSIHAIRKDREIGENYGDRLYREAGTARIRAVVTDASESLFMPAVYRVEAVEVIEGADQGLRAALLQEVVSYEGLYRDVMDDGKEIEAGGKLERINGQYYRLVVGTTGYTGGGYIRPAPRQEG